ncbi:hypothetical protein SAMN04487967_3349 [Natronorubrum sediminis]|uniref:DUF7344 domain-containing protein n=1 Tax=Natronorubrum sediminis TaxID=640943 RepID=A0A1H6G541_9EURY|nr:hypothetical protein [Natronorubrum sediminis]SEH17702.1 hypothetical protein SAMN04487967_3349 [Natronorubrum sediminis]
MGDDLEETNRRERRPVFERTERLADDSFYRALASSERRRVLYLLLDKEQYTIERLATALTGWDATDSETMRTPADYEQRRIRLVHADLPFLVEADLIRYDVTRGTVHLESLDPVVRDLIEASIETERRQRG